MGPRSIRSGQAGWVQLARGRDRKLGCSGRGLAETGNTEFHAGEFPRPLVEQRSRCGGGRNRETSGRVMSNSKNSTEDSGPTEPTLVGEDDNAALIWRRKHPPLKISGSPSSNNEAGTSSWPLPEPPKVQFIATRKTFDNVASVRPNNVVIMAIFGYDPERFQGLLEHVLGASLADESYVP